MADIGVAQEGGSDWTYNLADDADLQKTLSRSDNIEATYVDVTNPDSCADAVAQTVSRFGRLDILVNNAGIVDSGPVANFDEQAWDRIFAVNTKGIFLMTQAALPELRKQSNTSIVNTASIAGKKGYRIGFTRKIE